MFWSLVIWESSLAVIKCETLRLVPIKEQLPFWVTFCLREPNCQLSDVFAKIIMGFAIKALLSRTFPRCPAHFNATLCCICFFWITKVAFVAYMLDMAAAVVIPPLWRTHPQPPYELAKYIGYHGDAQLNFPLPLSRWPLIQSARPAPSPASPAPTQAASVHHVAQPQLTGQSEEPEPAAHSRPGGRLAEYGGMRPAAGQLGPGQQCGPGEQVSWPPRPPPLHFP